MEDKIVIDVIILSYANDDDLKALTMQSIDTLMSSEDSAKIEFCVLVIESNKKLKPYQYPDSKTLYTEVEFGYNRYMNIGIKTTNNPYICLCNNDLIFHKNWATNILKQMQLDPDLLSVNPYCDISHSPSILANGSNIYNTKNGILIGWCIFFKRSMLELTGYLDERFKFWYADNDYGSTMAKYHIKHALVTSSKVTHVGSKTHALLNDVQLFEYTYGQYLYYDKKWNNMGMLHYYFKTALLPLFKYVFINRQKNSSIKSLNKILLKLYGGLR